MAAGNHWCVRNVCLTAVAVWILCAPAAATVEFGESVQLSGNFETQNLVREPEFGEFEFIQNRNMLRIRVDWDWMQDGRLFGRFNVPLFSEVKFYLLYRGVYDGFYDLAPGGNQTGQARADDLIGGPIEGNPAGTCRDAVTFQRYVPCPVDGNTILRQGAYSRLRDESRDAVKFENRLREVFFDLTVRDWPLTLRVGRQQVIWGEADQFRLMDIWNPLDVTWRFPVADTFDDFRVPLWMIKGIYDLGTLGPLQNTYVEVVYNPFDFQPGQKVAWLPRPWSLPFPNPLRSGQVQAASIIPGQDPSLLVSPQFDLGGTSFKKGDFERNPQDASEVGARVHFVTPQGIESTINYIYGRGKWVGTSPAFGVKIKEASSDLTQTIGTFRALNGTRDFEVQPAFVRAEIVHPYVHVFGLTGNFFEEYLTSAVLRMEMAYALGEPYPTTEEDKLIEVTGGFGRKVPVGFTKRDVWAGMLGFDRPTWIRWLNNKSTFFISGQFFWTHVLGRNVNKLRGFSSASRAPYFSPNPNGPLDELGASGGFGVWTSGDHTGLVERVQNGDLASADNVLPWEFLFTLTVQTFYRGGTVEPRFILLADPVNRWFSPFFQLSYIYTNQLIFTLQQRVFVPLDPPTNDPWFVGRFGRRSESGVRVTYQF